MIKPTRTHYYYGYTADDGLVLSLPVIPVASSVEQLKHFYEMYKDQLSENLRKKQHHIIKVTTSYEEIKEL